jgi:hypothetical protein
MFKRLSHKMKPINPNEPQKKKAQRIAKHCLSEYFLCVTLL